MFEFENNDPGRPRRWKNRDSGHVFNFIAGHNSEIRGIRKIDQWEGLIKERWEFL